MAKEIDERIRFVEQMKTMNHQKKYENLIVQQVAEKLRTLKKLRSDQNEILFVNSANCESKC